MNAPLRPAIDWSDLLQSAPYFTSLVTDALSPEQALEAAPLVRAVYFYDLFDGQVSNGGVMQYFYNLALSTPGFAQVPDFVAQNPHLAQALPFVEAVHAAWAGVAPAVREARDSDEWPESLFSAHRAQFEALEKAFYEVNHAISQGLCAAIVQSPHDYFDIEAVPALPTEGVAHIALRDGTHRLRFENGFPVGPNLLDHSDGRCDVVWFSRDRQLLQAEGGHGDTRTRRWLHYPSQSSGSWHFKAGRLQSQEGSRSLWTAHGLREYFQDNGARKSASLHHLGAQSATEHFFPDGTPQLRHDQRADGEHRSRYWPDGTLNTQSVYDATLRRERYSQVRDAKGHDIAPGGTGRLYQCLSIDKGEHRWREGDLVDGYLEGPVRWMKSQPDGSAASEVSRAVYRQGKER